MFWLLVNSVCSLPRLLFLSLTLLFLQPAGWERAGSPAGRWPEQLTQTMQRAISCYLMQCSAIAMGWARSVCLWECLPIQLLLGDWLHTGLPVRRLTALAAGRAFSPLHSLNFLWLDHQVFLPLFFLFCPSCCWGCWWASSFLGTWGQPTTILPINSQESPIYFSSFLTSPPNKETYL